MENFIFYSPFDASAQGAVAANTSSRASTVLHPLGANAGAARDSKQRYFVSLGLHTAGVTCTDLPLVRAMHKVWNSLHVSRNLMDDTYVDPDDREACKLLRRRGEAEVSFWVEAVDYVTFLPSTHSEFKVCNCRE